MELGIEVIMTSNKHKTGTDRIGEVAIKIPADLYVIFLHFDYDDRRLLGKSDDSYIFQLHGRHRTLHKGLCHNMMLIMAFTRISVPSEPTFASFSTHPLSLSFSTMRN